MRAKEFIKEVEIIPILSRDTFVSPYNHIRDHDAKKISVFYNHNNEPHDVYRSTSKGDDKYYFVNADNKNQFTVSGEGIRRNGKTIGLMINGVGAIPKSSVRAADAYKHLILHHGLNLVSDTSQTKRGQKIWHRLGSEHVNSLKKGVEPDIQTHIVSGNKKIRNVPTTYANQIKYNARYNDPFNRSHDEVRLVATKNPNKKRR